VSDWRRQPLALLPRFNLPPPLVLIDEELPGFRKSPNAAEFV